MFNVSRVKLKIFISRKIYTIPNRDNVSYCTNIFRYQLKNGLTYEKTILEIQRKAKTSFVDYHLK